MEKNIEQFIGLKKLAIAGVSRNGGKFGNTVLAELKNRGYTVYALNPLGGAVGADKLYPDFASLPEKVEGVVVCVGGEKAVNAIRQAAAAGVKNVWLQQMSESPAALDLVDELKLNAVSGKCILMYAPPVGSFHVVHRFVARLLGQL